MRKKRVLFGILIFLINSSFITSAPLDNDTLNLPFKEVSLSNFNGASYTIRMDDYKNLPVTNLTNLLSGLVPGYFSYQTSGGMVNESSNFWLRGIRTNTEGVLVLVDGQERDFGVLSSHEIESITVLKDALASALYGTRAANGIILVNTKKGRQGKTVVDLTVQLINQKPIGLLKPLGALDYVQHYNEALKYDGSGESNMYPLYYLEQYRNRTGVNDEAYPDVNWMDDYFKQSSWVQKYNLSVTGGTNKTKYFINAGFLTQNGMFIPDNEFSYNTNNKTNRFNLRSNLQVDVSPTTLLNLDLYGWYDKQNRPGGDSYGLFNSLITTPANAFPPYYIDNGEYLDQNGNLIQSINGKLPAGNGLVSNPWAILNRNGYAQVNRVYGSFRVKLTQDLPFIAKGLKASAVLSMDSYTTATTNRTKDYAYYQLIDLSNPNFLRRTGNDERMRNSVTDQSSQTKTSLDLQLSYDKKIDDHTVSAFVFYNQYEVTNQKSIPSRFQTTGAWLNYDYSNKYSIDLIGSYQGIYKFSPDNRFGFFPSIAAGWTISNEEFFESLREYVPFFKLRSSYGIVGNQLGISEFYYMGRLNSTNNIYNFGNTMQNQGGYVEDIIANPNLTWEKVRQFNIGTNLDLLNNRLHFVFDYFYDERDDMYMSNNKVTSLLGTVANIEENIGKMHSNGYEMALSWNSNFGDFNYNLGATYSFYKNMIDKTGEVDEQYPWLMSAGYPRGIRRGYSAIGLFKTYEEIAASPTQTFSDVQPGDIRYKDINGDGIIDRNDQIVIGYGDVPRIFYGIHAGLSYKNFGFNILFQGAGNVTTYLSGKVAYPFYSNGTIYEHQLNYWTPENQSNPLPNISRLYSNVNNSQSSSFWIRDSKYVRLKNVEVYYDLPENLLERYFISGLRLFVNGYNLHAWYSDELPIDPEDRGNSDTMPLTRNLSFGLSVKF